MIQKMLKEIVDPKDYKLALRVVNYESGGFDGEEKEEIIALYEKYAKDVTGDGMRKTLILLDTTEKAEDLSDTALKDLLTEENRNLLRLVAEVVADPIKDAKKAVEAVKTVLKSPGLNCLRVALARVVLDKLAIQVPMSDYRDEIHSLSMFLQGCTEEELYQGSILVLEVKWKWQK